MRFAVCDDEAELRRSISDNIKLFSPGAAVTEFSSGKELLASADGFDIIFLDIGMDGPDGMQTAKELRKNGWMSAIIFVTAFEDRVFDAFDVGAFHYLVKPVSVEKFAEVLQKAIDSRTQPPAAATNDRYIAVKSGGVSTKLALSEIIYAEVYDRMISTLRSHCRTTSTDVRLTSFFKMKSPGFTLNNFRAFAHDGG